MTLTFGTTQAHDHVLPSSPVLSAAGIRQTGELVHFSWTSRESRSLCKTVHGRAPFRFPSPPAVSQSASLEQRDINVVLYKKEKPGTLYLYAWRAIAQGVIPPASEDLPIGVEEDLPYRLRPVRARSGIVAWIVTFKVRPIDRYYLEVYASWRDRDGCGRSQMAMWLFSFETKISPKVPHIPVKSPISTPQP